MSVQLAPPLCAKIEALLATGQYADADEALDRALSLLLERERRLEWLRAELALGEEDEERGDLIDLTPGYFEDVRRRAREQARLDVPIPDHVKP